MIYPNSCISFGGGVNSVAMTILLVNQGWHGPIIFADTGTEWPETYEYMEMFEQKYLKPRELKITWLDDTRKRKRYHGLTLIEYCEKDTMLPLARTRWCTVEYKVKPLGKLELSFLMGVAADESHRATDQIRPLCDMHITREQCKRIIKAEGLSVPMKSGCYICPFQKLPQWRLLWEKHPELFERAARLEELVSKKLERKVTLDPSLRWTLRDREIQFRLQQRLW